MIFRKENTMEPKFIKIERLTDISQEEFAPYGQIIGLEDTRPLEDFKHLNFWTHNVDIGGFCSNRNGTTSTYMGDIFSASWSGCICNGSN
jgi:hypothetical protein